MVEEDEVEFRPVSLPKRKGPAVRPIRPASSSASSSSYAAQHRPRMLRHAAAAAPGPGQLPDPSQDPSLSSDRPAQEDENDGSVNAPPQLASATRIATASADAPEVPGIPAPGTPSPATSSPAAIEAPPPPPLAEPPTHALSSPSQSRQPGLLTGPGPITAATLAATVSPVRRPRSSVFAVPGALARPEPSPQEQSLHAWPLPRRATESASGAAEDPGPPPAAAEAEAAPRVPSATPTPHVTAASSFTAQDGRSTPGSQCRSPVPPLDLSTILAKRERQAARRASGKEAESDSSYWDSELGSTASSRSGGGGGGAASAQALVHHQHRAEEAELLAQLRRARAADAMSKGGETGGGAAPRVPPLDLRRVPVGVPPSLAELSQKPLDELMLSEGPSPPSPRGNDPRAALEPEESTPRDLPLLGAGAAAATDATPDLSVLKRQQQQAVESVKEKAQARQEASQGVMSALSRYQPRRI